MDMLTSLSYTASFSYRQEDQVSVFSSTVGKPALGKPYSYLIDTSIMLSTVPKTLDDAEIVYGDNVGQAKYSNILEILHDKNANRAERWAAFDIINGVEIKCVDGGRS